MTRGCGRSPRNGVQSIVATVRLRRGWLLVAGLLAGAAPAAGQDLPVSLERIRTGVERPVALEIDTSSLQPVATFRTGIDQTYLPTLEEQLRKEFTLNAFQRQSAEWGAKCCGLGLGAILDTVNRAWREERERRIRERIAREVEALKAEGGRQ